MDNATLLQEIAFAAEEMHPSEDPDDFAELMKRVMRAVRSDVSPFNGLWRVIAGHLGDRAQAYGYDVAEGRVAPTPRFRRTFVGVVKKWLEEGRANRV